MKGGIWMIIDFTGTTNEQLVEVLANIGRQDLVEEFYRTGVLTVDEVYDAVLKFMAMNPIYPKFQIGWLL